MNETQSVQEDTSLPYNSPLNGVHILRLRVKQVLGLLFSNNVGKHQNSIFKCKHADAVYEDYPHGGVNKTVAPP